MPLLTNGWITAASTNAARIKTSALGSIEQIPSLDRRAGFLMQLAIP
jgi:hypothetical protein